MVTLVLAHKKITSILPRINTTIHLADAEEWFLGINQKGIFTFGMLGVVFLSIASYLVSLYFGFTLGFQMRKNNEVLSKLSDNVLAAELKLQSSETNLVKDNVAITKSMEEITSIKYITPEDSSVSLSK